MPELRKAQAGGWDLSEAAAALAKVEVAGLAARLYPPRPRTAKGKVMGRPAYSRESIVRALLLVAHPDVAVSSVAALRRQLRNNPALRAVCGFGGKIPSQQVFCEVYKRFAEHPEALSDCFAAIANRVKEQSPEFGRILGVDSTTVSTHCNPNRRARRVSLSELARYDQEDAAERARAADEGRGGRWKRRIRRAETSDPEASWTRKNQAGAPGGKQWVFGYKMHTLGDAVTGLPLAIAVTTGSVGDSKMLPALVEQAQAAYPWLEPIACSADRGYDAIRHYAYLLDGASRR